MFRVFLLSLLLALFAGCGGGLDVPTGGTAGDASIEGNCENVHPVGVPSEQPREPGTRRVVVLVDRESSRDEYSRKALILLPDLLPELLGPGDQVLGLWLGSDPSKDFSTLFLRYTVPLPEVATPEVLLAGVPVLPDRPEKGTADQACRGFAEKMREYDSEVALWNAAVAEHRKALSSTAAGMAASVKSELSQVADIAAPPPLQTPVCQALHRAAQVLMQPLGGRLPTSTTLLVFSDMADTFVKSPADLDKQVESCRSLRLEGTRVAVAGFYCDPEWPRPVCAEGTYLQDLWNDVFHSAGVEGPVAFIPTELTEIASIIDSLGVTN